MWNNRFKMKTENQINPYLFAGLPEHVREVHNGGGKIKNFKKEMVSVLLQNACNLTGCNYEDLLSGKRLGEIVKAKRIFCHFMREYTNSSLQKIGNYIDVHHATALHHIRTCKDYLDIKDEEYLYLTKQYKKINSNMIVYWIN